MLLARRFAVLSNSEQTTRGVWFIVNTLSVRKWYLTQRGDLRC